jgi:hypothetical protein
MAIAIPLAQTIQAARERETVRRHIAVPVRG